MSTSNSEPLTTEEKAEDLELPQGMSANATGQSGYQVQARYNNHEPKQFGELILDKRWKTLYFPKSPIGVPSRRQWDWHLGATECLSFPAAQALRWWFMAQCHCEEWGGGLCVETRIVAFRIEYSVKSTAEMVLEEDKDAWRKRPL